MGNILFLNMLIVARIAIGLFFVFSGYHKLFNKDRHATLVVTLQQCKVPYLPFMQWWVPGWELAGGIMVISGWWPLTIVGSAALIVICTIACVTDGRKRIVSEAPIDRADTVDDVLYLPEFLYIILLLIFMAQAIATSGM
jgi:putative oxidoreductase